MTTETYDSWNCNDWIFMVPQYHRARSLFLFCMAFWGVSLGIFWVPPRPLTEWAVPKLLFFTVSVESNPRPQEPTIVHCVTRSSGKLNTWVFSSLLAKFQSYFDKFLPNTHCNFLTNCLLLLTFLNVYNYYFSIKVLFLQQNIMTTILYRRISLNIDRRSREESVNVG